MFKSAIGAVSAALLISFSIPTASKAQATLASLAAPGAVAVGALSNRTAPLADLSESKRSLFGDRGAAPLLGGRAPRQDDEIDAAKLAAMPSASGGAQWTCLTEAIYFEARGESVEGQVAVAEVILNRVDSPRYPSTICGVVNQGTGRLHACQFSYTCDGQPEVVDEPRAWERAGKIARLLIDGHDRLLTDDATHYHADYVEPHWAAVYPQTARVGRHLFYRYIPGA
ncbi:cell wall hydrolase [Jannaschia seohaensis]|uniref:Cell wall hydrolase n=1 Tax=Jannaschia seohaensis TaxID=475081 RepID=A0A2Y9ARW6_9RHOB|nr:cell wall hydrolase [Jannaschia seohaensis]PWJ18311.1 cell wall hydrolase [Jannaschia seohaensis]SSA46836.1 Cell Wall Hydrolase [Jannaschia seohaensis]